MTAHIGDLLKAVRERRLYDKCTEISMLAGERPNIFRWPGIADVKQGAILRFHQKSNGGHDVANLDCCNGMPPDRGRFALAQREKPQHRNSLGWPGNAREVWPYLIVEKGLGQSVDNAVSAPDVDGNLTFPVEIIGQGAERHHVIQMNVSHEYISDFLLGCESQHRGGGASIDEQRVIDKKRGKIMAGKLTSRTT